MDDWIIINKQPQMFFTYENPVFRSKSIPNLCGVYSPTKKITKNFSTSNFTPVSTTNIQNSESINKSCNKTDDVPVQKNEPNTKENVKKNNYYTCICSICNEILNQIKLKLMWIKEKCKKISHTLSFENIKKCIMNNM